MLPSAAAMNPMQKLLQLPASAVNLVRFQQGMASEEAKSPVLTPDGGQQVWYNAMQADELRLLKSPEQAAAPENSTSGSQTQPLR